jgi:hypothetical protein
MVCVWFGFCETARSPRLRKTHGSATLFHPISIFNWWDSCPFCGSRAKHLNDCNFRLIIPTSVAKSAQRTIWRIHPDGSHAPDASAPYNLGVVPWLFVLADEDSMVGGTHCFFRAISSLNWAQCRLGI